MPRPTQAEKIDVHRTLAVMITVLARGYELSRQGRPNGPHMCAFVGQAFKCALEASKRKDSWWLQWPLLGLPDPDERGTSHTPPTGRVGSAAYRRALADCEERILSRKPAARAREGRLGKQEPSF